MNNLEHVLRIPRVGVEHEYRWVMGADSSADAAAHDTLRDQLVRMSGLRLSDQAVVSQHTLCFDDTGWSLSSADCSLTMLVNTNRGPSWLVAKETVQWVDGRRDVLEMTEYVPDAKNLAGAEVIAGRPGQYLSRRVPTLGHLRVFGYLSQRRTKAALLTEGGALIAVSCDAVELRDPTSRPVDAFVVVELEANQASRVDLAVLADVAETFSSHFELPAAQATKPQLAAARLGWTRS
ncbi:hypothetical protein ACFVX9_32530 [Kitasatospora sp. NPDC058243]|uniref:hypothetical protein n=1 Tax=Kitasatospora sp. NPDC058243 TaxID=3346397 RepID=UPI0036D93CF1